MRRSSRSSALSYRRPRGLDGCYSAAVNPVIIPRTVVGKPSVVSNTGVPSGGRFGGEMVMNGMRAAGVVWSKSVPVVTGDSPSPSDRVRGRLSTCGSLRRAAGMTNLITWAETGPVLCGLAYSPHFHYISQVQANFPPRDSL